MKRYNILLVVSLFVILMSCGDEEVAEPTATFEVSSTEVGINETVTFTYNGTDARQVVVFPGDEGHEWSNVNNGGEGFVMSKGKGTYSYPKAGIYTATIVATNYGDNGKNMKKTISETKIVVKDNNNHLKSVTLQKDLYNKEMGAEILDDNIVLITMPYKVRVANKDVAVKINAQRLAIVAESENAIININGEPYNAQTKYDLSNSLTIDVTAASGDTRRYDVFTICFPVFENFTVGGIGGTTTFSSYNYDKSYISIKVPQNMDLQNVVPHFASSDANSVTVNGVEQISDETSVDLSSPVTYVLTNRSDNNPSVICKSEVIVTVTKE